MKKEFNRYRYYDYIGIQDHLTEMAARGLQLRKTGNHIWQYEECPPEELRYCMEYRDKDSSILAAYAGNDAITQEAVQSAAEKGWTFIDTWANLRIYSTREVDAAPLEKDSPERFEKIKKVTNKTFTVPMIILFVFCVILLLTNVRPVFIRPLENLCSYTSLLVAFSAVFAGIVTLLNMIQGVSWLRRSEKSIKEGGICADPHSRTYMMLDAGVYLLLGLFLVVLALSITNEDGAGAGLHFVVYFVSFMLLLFLCTWITSLLKEKHASKGKIVLVTIIEVLAIVGILTFVPFFDSDTDTSHYEAHGKLPVTLEALGQKGSDLDECYYHNNSTFILSRVSGDQWHDYSDDGGYLGGHVGYSINRIKNSDRYDWFFKKAFYENTLFVAPGASVMDDWEKVDEPSWGAETVYRSKVYVGEISDEKDFGTEWILGTGEYIIYVSTSWEPTDDQKKIIVDKLIDAIEN